MPQNEHGIREVHGTIIIGVRRIQARCGGAKAVVATARKIAERVYRMLKYGQEYVRQAEQAYQEAYRLRTVKAMARKAESLGYKLVPATVA